MSNRKPKTTRSSAGSGGGTARGGMAAAFAKEDAEVQKKRDVGFMPFRLWMRRGEEVAVTFLDESLKAGFYRHEHNLKVGEKKWIQEPCRAEVGKCEHCAEGSKESIVAFLSVQVHKPYTSKKTGETHPTSKMFLTFKRGQYEGLELIEKIALKKYGTLRGVTVWLKRKDEENSFSSGEPVPNGDGEAIDDFYTEEELVAEFGHPAVKGRESGKIVKAENEDIKPYPYKKLMPPPTADDSEAPVLAGSMADSEAEYDDGDEIPGLEEDAPKRRTRRKQSAEPEPEEEPEEEEEYEEEEEPAPKRTRTRSRANPDAKPKSTGRTRTRTRTKPAPAEDEEPTFED